jgi:hypothetical protein
MKAIDGDALYKYLSSKYDEIEDILEIIENQPELKAIPVGEWRKEYIGCMYDVCSECGQKVTSGYFEFKYCPNCGAYMKKARINK